MKLAALKHLIREEIYNCKLSILHENITTLHTKWQNKRRLHEGILTSIFNFFLAPKYKKKAEAFKNTPEYKELVQQVKVSAESLEMYTKRLKNHIDEYESNINKLQKAGVKVTMNMSGMEQWKAFKEWQATRNKNLSKKYPGSKNLEALFNGTKHKLSTSDFNDFNYSKN